MKSMFLRVLKTTNHNISQTMYGQDTSITQIIPYPGFGYGAMGAGGFDFPPFFIRSDAGPVPLAAAKAFKLQGNLVLKTPNRVKVSAGHSENGFAVLAGRSTDLATVQVLLNNYQLNYDIPKEIATRLVSFNSNLC